MIADLSDVGYGISLVSDYKYGYAVENNTMRYVSHPGPGSNVLTTYSISLLRSATAPDAEMDMGIHEFTFAIMPHVNRMQESGVYARALQYVNPVRSESF
jgi:alpha-mannosidase